MKDLDAFENMLVLDTLRGDDSTGVFLVDNRGNVDIAKDITCGATFLKSDEWRLIRNKAIRCGFALIGHNRKATRGTVTPENAHPFWVEDKIVLVHNGSMFGAHKHLADTEVDSHAIAHVLAEEPDTAKALQRVNAAFALFYYDIPNKTINLIRNKERPMHHSHTDGMWIFSSEGSILEFAALRADIKLKDKIVSQPIDLKSSWTIDNNHVKLKHEEVDTKYRGAFQQTTYSSYYTNYQCDEPAPDVTPTSSALVLPELKPVFKAWLDNRSEKKYDWQEAISYGRFKQLREGLLLNGNRVRVVVSDFDWMIDDPTDKCLLIGTWYNHDGSIQIPIVFPVQEDVLHDVVNTEGDQSFYVTINNHFWQRASVVQHKDVDPQRGFPYMWAEYPHRLLLEDKKQTQVH